MSQKRRAALFDDGGDIDDHRTRATDDFFIDPGVDRDVQAYVLEEELESDFNAIIIDSDDEDFRSSTFRDLLSPTPPLPEKIELERIDLECGTVRPGDVVELFDRSTSEASNLPRGDFFLVKSIMEDLETEEVFLSGFILWRTAHVGPLFDRDLNDLFMLLYARRGDTRPPWVQAIEETSVNEVMRKRTCHFTDLGRAALSCTDVNPYLPQRLTTGAEKHEWIFNKGALICRRVYIGYLETSDKNGPSFKGEARYMYQEECRDILSWKNSQDTARPGTSKEPVNARTSAGFIAKKHKRSESVEEFMSKNGKRGQPFPQRTPQKTFSDAFCGIGGASGGARDVGLRVLWGLEKDDVHMHGYAKNFPEARHFNMDAADFPSIARRGLHGSDHCHFSTCCQPWSPNHTKPGKNDEANKATIYAPAPILQKTKPATFTAEQTFGFLVMKKHRPYFRSFVNSLLSVGYNVRWEIQEMACLGSFQYRRRLIFVGAKIGHPIPPFAPLEHGPAGSGLKRYRTVHDAFEPIRRLGSRRGNDPYDRPDDEKRINAVPYDPKISLAPTLTCDGGTAPHFSGMRRNTVLELALLQGFSPQHQFSGTKTKAREQVGNAYGPIVSSKQFLQCAATQEAFDHGLIGSEDHIEDLYDHLESKGFSIPGQASAPINFFEEPSRSTVPTIQYRYLCQLKKSPKPQSRIVLFGKHQKLEPLPQARRISDPYPSFRLSDSGPDNRRSRAEVRPQRQRTHRRERCVDMEDEEIITIDDSD